VTTDECADALVPIEVCTVEFYGDEITGALVRVGDQPTIYVPIRPICDYLGLAWSGSSSASSATKFSPRRGTARTRAGRGRRSSDRTPVRFDGPLLAPCATVSSRTMMRS
jgi:hypothetical protein